MVRLRAVGLAAGVELKRLRNRLAAWGWNRDVSPALKDCGTVAIRDRWTFDDPSADALARSGGELLEAIAEVAAQAKAAGAALKKLDSKAQVELYNEGRQKTANLNARLERLRTGYAKQELELAHLIVAMPLPDGSITQLAPLVKYREILANLRRIQTKIQQNSVDLAALDVVIGCPFQSLVGKAATSLLVVSIILYSVTHWTASMPAHSLGGTATAASVSATRNTVGLTRDQLPLSAQLVTVQWEAWRPGSNGFLGWRAMPDADEIASGSSGVFVAGNDGQLGLITNRHVLDLANLMAAKANGDLAVKQYRIHVQLPSGRECPVLRVGIETSGLDLAVLQIDGKHLAEGKDYVMLPSPKQAVQIGDEVVAIGNPVVDGITLAGTETFGRISGFRSMPEEEGAPPTDFLQTDAAINHGNSGGPLLVRSGDQFFWVGINTLTAGRDDGVQGINFAIDAREVSEVKYNWFDATPEGIAAALTWLSGTPVGVFNQNEQ